MVKVNAQASLVMVFAVMVVSLAVGVSSAKRTISNIRRSAYTQQADQAYSCAQTGAEEAISAVTANPSASSLTTPTTLKSDDNKDICSYTYTVETASENGGAGCIYYLDTPITKDDVFQVDLKSFKGNITLHWGTSNDASIEVTLIKGQNAPYDVTKNAYYCDNTPSPSDGFEHGQTDNNPPFKCKTPSISVDNDQLARIRPLFNSANIKVEFNKSCNDVPKQGFKIISEGRAGDVIKKLQVKVTNPQMGSIFDYVLFSGGDITK